MELADYAIWAVLHLVAWLAMLLAAGGIGSLALPRRRFEHSVEKLTFSVALGLGLCALVLFVLGLLGLLYERVVVILTGAGALSTIAYLLYSLRGKWAKIRAWRPSVAATGLSIVALAYCALLLLLTQYPPVQWDAVSNHLVMARGNLNGHSLVVLDGIPQPVLPVLNHMLFTWALALKDDVLAQMVSHTFLMLTALGLYSYGKRQGRAALGLAAATLWLVHPLVLWLSGAAYVDLGVTCYAFLGLYSLWVFLDEKQASWWYLGLGLLGMGAGVKLTGLFFAAGGVGVGLWVLGRSLIRSKLISPRANRDDSESAARPRPALTWSVLAKGSLILLVTAGPWYAFITYHTGNPIWPTFAHLSKGIWSAPWIVDGVNNWMQHGAEARTIKNFVLLPFDFVFHPERFFADMGYLTLSPLIIGWPLAWLISFANRSVRWWTLWALAYTCFWFSFAHAVRYWLPVAPIAGLAFYESIQWMLERVSKRTAVHRAVWLSTALLAVSWSGIGITRQLWNAGLPPVTPDAREAFLARLGGYNGVRYLNKHADRSNDSVCVVNAAWLNYYLEPRVIDVRGAIYWNRLPTFQWPKDEEWVRWLERQNILWILVYHTDALLGIPKQNPVLSPYWPDYELVYSDSLIWVFRHKPVPPDVSLTLPGGPAGFAPSRLRDAANAAGAM